MQSLNIDEIKQVQLDILDEIARICIKNDIEFFLAYGSLIGAMRHQGIIPWDDDVDIWMKRSHYEKFIKCFDAEKSSDLYAKDFCDDGKSIFQFLKVVNTQTLVRENFIRKDIDLRIWVDVFPLDESTENIGNLRVARKISRLLWIRSFALADASVGSNAVVRLAKKIISPFARKVDVPKLCAKIDSLAKTKDSKGKPSSYLVDLVAEASLHYSYKKSWFDSVEYAKFEGREMPVPAMYDEILTLRYGNWRQVPKEEDRAVHICQSYRI